MKSYNPLDDLCDIKTYIELELNILKQIVENNRDYTSYQFKNNQIRLNKLNNLKKSVENIDLYLKSHKVISNADEAYAAFYEYKKIV